MAISAKKDSQDKLALIVDFVSTAQGLALNFCETNCIEVLQNIDGKAIKIREDDLDHVFKRRDASGQTFIQVNFTNGEKVLLTETLVGFKPQERFGLDMSRLPKVVTTSDIVSVFEAIQEALQDEVFNHEEIDTLKKVFESVVGGGEKIGFDLRTERNWLARLTVISHQSA